MKKIFIFLLVSITATAHAQIDLDEDESKANFGVGLGISYGGLGARMSYLPLKQLALFGAAGYNFNGLGYSFGTEIRLLPGKTVVPALLAMYGYNGVLVIQGAERFGKTYYGPTAGAGVEIHSRNQQNFFTLELLFPFRSQEFKDDVQDLKNNPDIELTGPFPVAFSVGYHFKF